MKEASQRPLRERPRDGWRRWRCCTGVARFPLIIIPASGALGSDRPKDRVTSHFLDEWKPFRTLAARRRVNRNTTNPCFHLFPHLLPARLCLFCIFLKIFVLRFIQIRMSRSPDRFHGGVLMGAFHCYHSAISHSFFIFRRAPKSFPRVLQEKGKKT